MMRRSYTLGVFFFVVSSACLCAQSTNASLTGRVTDPSKALIVGAKVAAVSDGTNSRYETTTNRSGEYYLPRTRSKSILRCRLVLRRIASP